MQVKDLRLRLSLKSHSGSGWDGEIGVHDPAVSLSGGQSTRDRLDSLTDYSYGMS